MSRSFHALLPSLSRQLLALGARLRDARLRRKVTSVLFAERMGVSRDTLHRMERGDPNIAIGTYAKALRVLGLDADIDLLAKEDAVGRALQDRALAPRRAGTGRGRAAAGDAVAENQGFDRYALSNVEGLSPNSTPELPPGNEEGGADTAEGLRMRNKKAVARLLKGRVSENGDGST